MLTAKRGIGAHRLIERRPGVSILGEMLTDKRGIELLTMLIGSKREVQAYPSGVKPTAKQKI